MPETREPRDRARATPEPVTDEFGRGNRIFPSSGGQPCPPRSTTGAIVASILIVEDSPDNMKLFRTLLTLKGHTITGILGGDDLFRTLGEMTPELVLMDIQMPGKDGYTLVGEIRASDHKGLRVIALTANAMAGDMEKAIAAGFDGYISKPIDIRKFPEQVAAALAGDLPRQR